MPLFRKIRTGSVLKSGAVLFAAAFVLASCGTALQGSSTARQSSTPIATASLPPSSVCGTNGDYVQQSLNGTFTGCFRVPALHSSSLVVALQAYLFGKTTSANATTTTLSPPASNEISLSLGSTIATPGESVTMTGRFLRHPPSPQQRPTYVTVCWDGCETGLQEEGVPIHWSSSTMFHTRLEVPETAWLVTRDGVVSVHPLQSGSYRVGVQYLEEVSGCALGPGEAQTTVQLHAHEPTRCAAGQPCETMTLSTPNAAVGDKVFVTGWAPLQTIIGQPFSYSLSVTSGSARKNYPALAFARNPKGGGFDVVLTPRTLRVSPNKTWASLGRVNYLSSTFAGLSAIQPASNSSLIAWCQASGLDITGGSSLIRVPTGGVAAALRGTKLSIFSSPSSNPQCSTVLLDPRYRNSVYAGFSTAVDHNAPPLYIAGLYTTDGGATWRTVPTPAGTSLEDFAGFTTKGSQVEALFAGTSSYGSGCPNTGPCTIFGPYQWGNCAMDGSPQPLLQGPVAATATSGIKWTSTSWAPTVNSCFSQQLVATSTHSLLLLDPSSQYPLLESTNSGQTWTYLALPRIPGANSGSDSMPLGDPLLLAPDGSLFAAITAASGLRQELLRLGPGAKTWCQVPKVFGVTASSGTVGPLRTRGAELIWSQTVYTTSGNPTSSMHVVALSNLRC